MASGKKQYGLQIPKKSAQPLIKRSVFGEDSDSDKSDGGDWMKKAAKTDFSSSIAKRQTKLEIEKALKEDATVFQYDEIYDEMDQQKQSSAAKKDKDKKPKYVEKLLVAAEKRKIENERRYERLVQKEREAEGDEFKDKETFVTSAYKKKLEEFAKLDEEEKRQDMLEEIGDVTKQQDISGFYRHLYQTTVVDKEDGGKEKENEQKEDESVEDGRKKAAATRQYRKRKDSNSSGGEKDKDADSNLGSSSSSESSSEESDGSGGNSSHSDTEDPKRIRLKKYNDPEEVKPKSPPKAEEKVEPKKRDVESDANIKKKEEPKEPPVDIWKKRTVGTVFDAAVERYLARKAARNGAAA